MISKLTMGNESATTAASLQIQYPRMWCSPDTSSPCETRVGVNSTVKYRAHAPWSNSKIGTVTTSDHPYYPQWTRLDLKDRINNDRLFSASVAYFSLSNHLYSPRYHLRF